MKISVLTNSSALTDEEWIRKLGSLGSVEYYQNVKERPEEELETILSESDIAVTGWGSPKLPDPKGHWKLKYICHITGEMKRIISPAYFNSSIVVTNWGDAYSFATAEGAVALLFSVLKQIPLLDNKVRKDGRIYDSIEVCATLHETKVGIYGFSTIGKLVAEYLRPFNPEISFYDPTVNTWPEWLHRCNSLEELFERNYLVTIHAGLNDKTRGSVDYSLLSKLPQGGVLINTARGPIVVEKDLGRILDEGRIRAGIDVSEFELDFRSSPYANTPNTIITGHSIAKTGPASRTMLQRIAQDNIKRFVNNEPLNHIVTSEKYWIMT